MADSKRTFTSRKCIIRGCTTKRGELPLHNIPKDPQFAKLWIDAIDDPELKKIHLDELQKLSYRVCKRHFTNACYIPQTVKPMLRGGSVPSLNLSTKEWDVTRVNMENADEQKPVIVNVASISEENYAIQGSNCTIDTTKSVESLQYAVDDTRSVGSPLYAVDEGYDTIQESNRTIDWTRSSESSQDSIDETKNVEWPQYAIDETKCVEWLQYAIDEIKSMEWPEHEVDETSSMESPEDTKEHLLSDVTIETENDSTTTPVMLTVVKSLRLPKSSNAILSQVETMAEELWQLRKKYKTLKNAYARQTVKLKRLSNRLKFKVE